MKPAISFTLLALAACTSEEGIKIYNNAPEATITSHASGAELMEAVEYTFTGQVSDGNHSMSELKVVWSTDTRTLCEESVPDASGATSCLVSLETSDTQLKLQVTDPEGSATLTSIDIVVQETEAPTIELLSPVADEAYYSDQLIQFSAIINDAEDDPADLFYVWSSNLDGDLPITTEPDSDGSLEGYLNLSAGQHAISLRVEDTTGKSKTETVAITVGGPNNEPLCSITAPEEGAAYVVGQNVSFAGTATDDDINNSLLSVSWESSVDGVFDTTSAITDGSLGFTTNALSAGYHTITLRVEDEVGGLCSDAVQIAIGIAPILTLTSPSDADVYSVGDSISFQASVEDQEDVPSDISLSWTSDIDGEFSTEGANSNGNISFNLSSLSAGLHSISVVATDSTGLTDSTSLSLRVNTPPTQPSVAITPDPASTNDGLVATASGSSDADGDNITYSYSWTQNGNATSYNTSSVPASATSAGEVWEVTVTPNDGYTDGNFGLATITIANSLPAISSVAISPSAANNDDVLTCSAVASDADETLTPTYTWMVGSVSYTGSTLDLSSLGVMPDDVVTCTAEVIDSAGASDSSSASLTISNRDPVVSATSITPTSAYTNTEVVCSASVSDADGETLAATYEWFAGTASIGNGSTLTLDNSLIGVGDALTCSATGTDSYGGVHSEDATITILNTDPVVDSVEIDLSTPVTTDVLTCSTTGSDIDGDTPTYSFSWSNLTTGDVYTSTTVDTDSATLDLATTSVAVDDEVECVVVASDANGGTDSDVAVVTIYNSGPQFDTAASIDISPDVYVGDVLTCSATASDLNDGSITPSFAWSVNGVEIATGATYTVDATNTDFGDDLVCTATATDSDLEVATSTATVTVQNTPPTVSNVVVTSDSGSDYNDDVLTCAADVEDVDENINNTQYIWSVGSSQLGTGSTLDLSTVSVMPNDEVVCTVQTMDMNYEAAEDTGSLTIANRAPTLSATSIDNTTPYADDTITCSANVTDADGETLAATYEWSNGSTVLGSGAALTLTPSDAGVGDTITCTASVSDGYGGSDSTIATASVQNTDPTMSAVSVSPSSPSISETLTCSATGTDLNDGALTAVYSWINNTTLATLGSASTLALDSSTSEPGDLIVCTVTYTDNNGGSVSDSSSATITNTVPVFDTATSITPNTGVFTGTALTCSAAASDADDGTVALTYSWMVGSVEVSTSSTYTVSASDTDVGDSITCTMTATDDDSATATSTASVMVENTEPTLAGLVITPSASSFNDSSLVCSATATDPDESVSPTYEWSVGSTFLAAGSTIDLSSYTVHPLDVVSCTVTVVDNNSGIDTASTTKTIANRAPTLSATSIDNTTPYADSTITCSASVTDDDGETLSATYEWSNGSTVLGTSASLTLTPSDAGVGDAITCTASVSDGYGGSDSTTATATVQNTDPTMSAVSVSPSSPSISETLTCSATGTDLNDGSLNPVYSWKNDTTGITLGSASTLALDSSTSEPGDLIVCTVTYTDNNGGSVSDSSSATITNTVPVFDTATSITPNTGVFTGTALTCSAAASDADDGTVALSYSWMVGSVEVSTSSTYTVSASDTDVGDTITCTATATDDDAATATSTASVMVENTSPSVSGATISGGIYNTDTLTCTATAADPDETLTVTYTWSIDSVEIGTGASIDLATTAALPADDVMCTASVEDGEGETASDSATQTLDNRVPTTPVVAISPTSPIAGADDLTCNITIASTDSDGQTVSYTYEWTVDGVGTSYTTDTIPASAVGASQVWMCTVTPDDGIDFGTSASDSVISALGCALTDCDESLDLGGGQGIDFVNITAGTFVMGSPSSEVGRIGNEDRHSVTLTNDFLLATTEITQGMYNQLMGYQAYNGLATSDSAGSYGVGTDYPAYFVSWNMAADFSNKLTQRHNSLNGTSLTECYTCSSSGTTSVTCSTAVKPIYECTGYRLPTEAEWEYAARAGTTAAVWTSNGGGNLPNTNPGTYILTDGFDLRTYGWSYSTYTSPYGSKEVATLIPNDNDLYDMSGNLWEWTHDTYKVSLGTRAKTDPVREKDSKRGVRGGMWHSTPSYLRSARRDGYSPSARSNGIGFRPGRTME